MAETVNYDYRRAALYALVAYVLIALGMIFFKLVVGGYPLPQVVLAECSTSMPLYLLLAKVQGGLGKLKTHYPGKQLARGILQICAAYCGLYALRLMSLSTVTMLGYASPFFTVLAARIFLKEKVSGRNWLLMLIGFVGVAFVAQPEGVTMLGVVLELLCCALFAGNVMLMKTMDKDANITFPFYTVLAGGILGLALTLYNGMQPFSLPDLFNIFMAGFTCFFGAQLLFASYRLAPLHFATPFQYTQLIWTVVIGYFIWADLPTPVQLAGVGIIAATSLYLTVKGKSTDQV